MVLTQQMLNLASDSSCAGPQSPCSLCPTPRSILPQPGPSAAPPPRPAQAPPHRAPEDSGLLPTSQHSVQRGPAGPISSPVLPHLGFRGFSLPCPCLSFQPRLPTRLPAPAEPSEVPPASHAPRPLALDTASPSLLTAFPPFPPAPSPTSDESSRPPTSAPHPCAGPFVPPNPRWLPSQSCSRRLVNTDASTLAFEGELLAGKNLVLFVLVYLVIKQRPEYNKPPVIERRKYDLGVLKKEKAFLKMVLHVGSLDQQHLNQLGI